MIPSRVRTEQQQDGWPPEEIVGQIYVARGHGGVHGHVHFSARTLMRDSLAQRLARTVYRYPALVPPSPWLSRTSPGAPRATLAADGAALTLAAGPGEPPRLWIVRARYGNRWTVDVVPATRTHVALRGDAPLREVVVSAVDRGGNEGPAVTLRPDAAVAADAAGAGGR
jgi:hypothetical protein